MGGDEGREWYPREEVSEAIKGQRGYGLTLWVQGRQHPAHALGGATLQGVKHVAQQTSCKMDHS